MDQCPNCGSPVTENDPRTFLCGSTRLTTRVVQSTVCIVFTLQRQLAELQTAYSQLKGNSMDPQVVINGKAYMPVSASGDIMLVVVNKGFVFAGRCSTENDVLTIRNARCLIRWGTEKHLGELTDGPTDDTTFGDRCTVRAHVSQVIFTQEVNQDAWTRFID
jgi:hypothetical protein